MEIIIAIGDIKKGMQCTVLVKCEFLYSFVTCVKSDFIVGEPRPASMIWNDRARQFDQDRARIRFDRISQGSKKPLGSFCGSVDGRVQGSLDFDATFQTHLRR